MGDSDSGRCESIKTAKSKSIAPREHPGNTNHTRNQCQDLPFLARFLVSLPPRLPAAALGILYDFCGKNVSAAREGCSKVMCGRRQRLATSVGARRLCATTMRRAVQRARWFGGVALGGPGAWVMR